MKNQYQQFANKELSEAFSELKNTYSMQNLPAEEMALNFLNLQQVWLRVEFILSSSKIDSGLEFFLAELLGHFYAAEALFTEVLNEKAGNGLKMLQSLKTSQELISDFAAFSAKYIISGDNLADMTEIISLNKNKSPGKLISNQIL